MQTRLPSLPQWSHAGAGELGRGWWCGHRWKGGKCVCMYKAPKNETKLVFVFFHMHFFLQWLSAFLFLLGQCDPASVVLLSLNFSISESGKSFWLIPQQSQTQSSHLMWAKELSCTQIWCNTRSFLPPIPGSRSSQQHVGFSITKLWGGYGVRVTSAEPVCKWCNQKHLIEENYLKNIFQGRKQLDSCIQPLMSGGFFGLRSRGAHEGQCSLISLWVNVQIHRWTLTFQ